MLAKSQTPTAAEHRVDSFSVSALKTLVILWNLAVKLLNSYALEALKVCIDTGAAYACRFLTTSFRPVVLTFS